MPIGCPGAPHVPPKRVDESIVPELVQPSEAPLPTSMAAEVLVPPVIALKARLEATEEHPVAFPLARIPVAAWPVEHKVGVAARAVAVLAKVARVAVAAFPVKDEPVISNCSCTPVGLEAAICSPTASVRESMKFNPPCDTLFIPSV